jgi:GAF domain-containing protein
MDRFEFNRQLAAAARAMANQKSTHGTVERAVQMATDMIASCDAAGISIVTLDAIETVAATTEELRKIDQLQFDLGQGPCRAALRQEEIVTTADLATDERWPTWGARVAADLNFHSTLSFRLFTDGDTLGALNLYSHTLDAFTHDDVLDGLALAAHAAVALVAAEREDQLSQALASRTVIGQATGVLMERFGLDPDTAFGVLARVSQQNNVKVRDLARNLVQTGRIEPGSD